MTSSRLSFLFEASIRGLPEEKASDSDLLNRFTLQKDEMAFAAIVTRYSNPIRAVYRGWLRESADLDDATQATFLVLVQRAESIRDAKALPAWLYRVAENIARRLAWQNKRSIPITTEPSQSLAMSHDSADVIILEISLLPEKYRLPIQLVYLADLSTARAAEQLGCPVPTLVTRLSRGRSLLQKRLIQRGIVLPVGVVVTLESLRMVQGLSPERVWSTAHAALAIQSGLSPMGCGVSKHLISLSQGVAQAMIWKNLKVIALVIVLFTALSGFILAPWANADNTKKSSITTVADTQKPNNNPLKPDDQKPEIPAPSKLRRNEATIRMPVGTFVKDFDVASYGTGRITWIYSEDRVQGVIEGNVMGTTFEVETDAEISLSGHGTIYGVLNSARVTKLKIGGELATAKSSELAIYQPIAESMLHDVAKDLPFSYQFRTGQDRLTITNYKTMLTGVLPYSKFAALSGGKMNTDRGVGQLMMFFEGFGAIIEGSYTSIEAKEKEKDLRKRNSFSK